MNERDTHFQGFAKLLMEDLLDAEVEHYHDNNKEDFIQTLIAQRAYDLVKHAIHAMEMDVELPFQDVIYTPLDIPDLTEWPEKPDETQSET